MLAGVRRFPMGPAGLGRGAGRLANTQADGNDPSRSAGNGGTGEAPSNEEAVEVPNGNGG